jgi:CheY-like chemotaxis protein
MSNALIVDDDAALLDLMQSILRRAGHTTVSTNKSEEGLAMAYQHRPDIIIVNDSMPQLSGGELCRLIKDDPQLSQIPVVIASAGQRVRDPKFIEQIGADAVLFKPYLPKDLINLVSQLLSQ